MNRISESETSGISHSGSSQEAARLSPSGKKVCDMHCFLVMYICIQRSTSLYHRLSTGWGRRECTPLRLLAEGGGGSVRSPLCAQVLHGISLRRARYLYTITPLCTAICVHVRVTNGRSWRLARDWTGSENGPVNTAGVPFEHHSKSSGKAHPAKQSRPG